MNFLLLLFRSKIEYRNPESHMVDIMHERNGLLSGSEQRAVEQYPRSPMMQVDRVASFGSEGNMPNFLLMSSISSRV